MEDYQQLKRQVDRIHVPKQYWQPADCKGTIPESREGAQIVVYNNCILLFGGMGSQRFNEIHEIPFNGDRWKKVKIQNTDYDCPNRRFGHSMILHENFLIVFGGAGDYIKKLKVHESYKDV